MDGQTVGFASQSEQSSTSGVCMVWWHCDSRNSNLYEADRQLHVASHEIIINQLFII